MADIDKPGIAKPDTSGWIASHDRVRTCGHVLIKSARASVRWRGRRAARSGSRSLCKTTVSWRVAEGVPAPDEVSGGSEPLEVTDLERLEGSAAGAASPMTVAQSARTRVAERSH